jgi:hypothetical protein
VRDAEVRIDRVHERTDRDDLRPQGERRQHNAGQHEHGPVGRRAHCSMMRHRLARLRQIPQIEDAYRRWLGR